MPSARLLLIGSPGSGKSTLARALAPALSLPLIHLDRLFWNEDGTTVPKPLFLSRLDAALAGERWIIDGNYTSTLEKRLRACDTVILLDYPPEICLSGIRERLGQPHSDLPWLETEPDPEFEAYVRTFREENLPGILALLARYPEKKVILLHTREEGDAFLAAVRETGTL